MIALLKPTHLQNYQAGNFS